MSYLTTPRLTTVERDALTNVQDGAQIFNTDTGAIEVTSDAGVTWVDLVSDISGASKTTVYVASSGGVDAVGNGGALSPYATISYALSQITDESASKPYLIHAVGVFTDTNWAIKPHILYDFNMGSYGVTNQVTLDAAWSAGGVSVIRNLSGLQLSGGALFDFNALTPSSNSFINFDNISIISTPTFQAIGFPTQTCGINFNYFGSGTAGLPDLDVTNASMTITNNTLVNTLNYTVDDDAVNSFVFIQDSLIQNTSVLENTSPTSSMGLDVKASSFGTVTFKSTGTGTFDINSHGTLYASSVTIDGSNTTLETDVMSGTVSYLNGAAENPNLHIIARDALSAGTGISYDSATGVITSTVAAGDLLAANNLDDVANKDTALRNLGAAVGDEQIIDNLDRVYTTATQPAVMQVFYNEPDHSIQLCPFNEVGSPTAGPFWGIIQSQGASSFSVNDASGAFAFTVLPGQAYLIKNNDQTLGGNIQPLPYTALVNGQVSASSTIGLSSAYEIGSLGNIGLESGRPFTVQSKGAVLDGLTTPAGGSSSRTQPGVEATVYSSTSDIRITTLSVIDAWFTLPGTRTVGVYDKSSQQLLGSIDIAKTDTLNGIYRQKDLTHYIDIPANTEFVVAKRYLNGEFIYGGSSAVGNSTITVVEGGESLNTPGLEFPATFDGTPGNAHAGFFTYEILSDVAEFTETEINLKPVVNFDSLTASTLVSTDGSKNLVSGNLTGDITTSGLASTLSTVNSNVGSFGNSSTVGSFTVDGKGRISAASDVTITPAAIGAPTTLGAGASGTWSIDVTGNAATVTTNANLTGDVTSVGNATTLATVATGATVGSSTQVPQVTFNDKGLVTGATEIAITGTNETLQEVYNNSSPGYGINLSNEVHFYGSTTANGYTWNTGSGASVCRQFVVNNQNCRYEFVNDSLTTPSQLSLVCHISDFVEYATQNVQVTDNTPAAEECEVGHTGISAGTSSTYLKYFGSTDSLELIDSKVISTTATTSSTTGSLINAGGFGNAGDAWIGGDVNIEGQNINYDTVISSETVFTANTKKIVANGAITAGSLIKASATEFRVEEYLSTDVDTTGIVGIAATAAAIAGDVIEVYNLEVFPVITNSIATSAGDFLEASGVVDGRVVSTVAGPGVFAVSLQDGVANDTILAAHIMNEVF